MGGGVVEMTDNRCNWLKIILKYKQQEKKKLKMPKIWRKECDVKLFGKLINSLAKFGNKILAAKLAISVDHL